MSTLKYIRARAGSRDGIALVMVLAFIVLLTILIVSFIAFTRLNRMSTASYSKSIQAQEIAEGGMQDILSDLHAEIIAGSTNNASVYVVGTNSYARVYIPTTNYTASPAHLGYDPTAWGTDINTPNDSLSPTLIRVSRASQDGTATDFFPPLTNSYYDPVQVKNLLNRASKANSSTPSINGRYISASRWNKTFFLACTSVTDETNSYYMPGVFVSTNYPTDYAGTPDGASAINPPWGPPDWVYVTRAGSRVCNSATELAQLLPSTNLTTSYTVTAGQNPPASPVVGRYAYIMYDEGAMLDSSVAGFYSTPQTYTSTNVIANVTPTSVYPNTTQTVMGKTFLPYADLSLPPLLGTQANVNAFVAFRNGSLGTPSNSTYLNAAFNYGLKGFLSFQAGDSPMLGRQDLINYFAKADSNFNTGSVGISRALPYFGTFSRAVSAPSYSPPADATTLGAASNGTGNIYAYHANAEVSTASPFSTSSPNPNRDLANVRFVNAGTITHYTDDATATALTYNVNVGDPLLASRFSLAKIAWLSQVNPNLGTGATLPATYAAPIQACFGLTWGVVGSANGGNPCWSYVGSPVGTGGTASGTTGAIETLDQVAKENRETNFFELLKATILNGSLGQNPGQAGWRNGLDSPTEFRDAGDYNTYPGSEDIDAYSFDRTYFATMPTTFPVTSIPAPAVVPDVQIMKIGADIIDQFDADSYPTAIYFNYFANPANTTNPNASNYDAAGSGPSGIDHTRYGEANMVYGDENLPYLQSVYMIAGTLSQTPGTSGMNGWLQPQLWNPHQVPASFPAATPQLTSYQIRAYGQAGVSWSKEYTPPGSEASSGLTAIPSPGVLDGSFINFTLDATGNQQIATNPMATVTSAGNIHFASTAAGTNSGSMTPSTMEDYAGNQFVGFWIGTDPGSSGQYILDSDTYAGTVGGLPRCYSLLDTTGPISLALGWTDSNGGFHPYSFMTQMAGYAYGVVGNEKNGYSADIAANDTLAGSAIPSSTGDDCHFTLDPRTFRFGSYGDWGAQDAARPAPYCGTTTTPATTLYSSNSNKQTANSDWGVALTSSFTWATSGGPYYMEDWEVNSAHPLAQTAATASYYSDIDGVVRPGDGVFGNQTTGDGMQLFNSAGTDGTAVGDTGGNSQHGRRPVVLNRPFHNVGELGYAFRDLPFKTLDFFTTLSADAALLDVFSTTDEAQVSSSNQISAIVAGRINPSNAPYPVLEAILSYGAEKDLDPTYNMLITGANSNAKLVAQKIASQLSPATGTGPISSRAGLVTQLGANPTTGIGAIANGFPAASAWNKENKAYLEGPVRALSNVTNARTWNLMVDIIAQSGHLAPTAKTLDDFVVEGEKRYWLHIAIDRYTGKIVDQQLEPVYE